MTPLKIISGNRQSVGRSPSTKIGGHAYRASSPKSPVASASAFESVEGSDEDDALQDSSKLDTSYMHSNGNAVSPIFGNLIYFCWFLYILNGT